MSNGLPALYTAGNQIRRSDTHAAVLLRGVNRSGLEYSELPRAGISQLEIQEITRTWRSNIIRLPFNQEWVLRGSAWCHADSYLNSLDQVIEWASAGGAYTLLDLQWLDRDTPYGVLADGSVNHVPPLPNADSISLWRQLAERYREEPAVLFDLLNEPHDPLKDDSQSTFVIGRHGEPIAESLAVVTAAEWNPWAGRLLNEIRAIHPESLIFIGGVNWAYDLRGVFVEASNVVYSTHVYSNRKPSSWDRYFGNLAKSRPVFAGEWGGGDDDLAWGRRLETYLSQRNIGWTAWSWADKPHLIERDQSDFTATAFGGLVRDVLIRTAASS